MLGRAVHPERMNEAERFNGSSRPRRGQQHYVPRSSSAAAISPLSTSGEPGRRSEMTENRKSAKVEAGRREVLHGNLDRFLKATTPYLPAHYPSKTKMRPWRTCNEQCEPYFILGDLWESFNEWSAYGAGVPIVLNGRDSVVQYYVPYLSGIQLYANSTRETLSTMSLGEDSDVESFRESCSDGSSDSEIGGSKYPGKLLLEEKHMSLQEGFSSGYSDNGESQGCLIFEYLEHDRPYCREPLTDKVADLAQQFPALKTIRSCDLLPCSWFSVAWYPIYRIPTGPTLRDLDACFLTFHSLSIPAKDATIASGSSSSIHCGFDAAPSISLPVFGLASYKFKSYIWISNGGQPEKLANALFQSANNWLRLLNVNLPDHRFFASHSKFFK